MDCVVKSWILRSIYDDLAEAISAGGISTHATWVAVES